MKMNNDYNLIFLLGMVLMEIEILMSKNEDENTYRVSGNKVFVPPRVVENEGKHPVDKHLQPEAAFKHRESVFKTCLV